MAGLGSLVEARFPPLDRVGDEVELPAGLRPRCTYEGPAGPLVAAEDEACRAVWIGRRGLDPLHLPWGTMDSIDDAGAYRRIADGVRSLEGGVGLVARLVGTSLRTSGRWVEVAVDDGPTYEARRSFFRGARLLCDGMLLAKGFRGKVVEVASEASVLDAMVVTALRVSLWRMMNLPKIPEFEIPGD